MPTKAQAHILFHQLFALLNIVVVYVAADLWLQVFGAACVALCSYECGYSLCAYSNKMGWRNDKEDVE
jgi:hypothetical protein